MAHDSRDSRLLVAEILDGNRQAFEEIIRRYQRLVSHMVFRMVSNGTDREDLCQEVFIKVYRNLGSFRFGSKLSTWIAQVAYNTCINHLEKKRLPLIDDVLGDEADGSALERQPDRAFAPDDYAERKDIGCRVRVEIAKLPAQYRAVLTMYHLDDMCYEEIVQVTGLPMGTVKSHLFRARKLLKERLTEKYVLEDIWQ